MTSGPAPLHILVIEDDLDTRANLCDILELDDHRVETAGSVTQALNRTNWSELSAIILDRKLPDGSAEDLLPRLRELAPNAAVMIVTGYADLQGAIAALRLGAADYVLKPINPEKLRASLAHVAERLFLAREKERSDAAFRTLVEAAPCMILIERPDHSILYFSPFAERITGYRATEVIGEDYLSLFVVEPSVRADLKHDMARVLKGQPSLGIEYPIRCKDGTRRHLVWNRQLLSDYQGGPAVLAVGQDVTPLIESQAKALQSERLAAIGQMMTGLAHESGNALARSQSCLEMLAWEVEDRPQALDLIQRIQTAQDHLRQLYEEVRNYAAPLKLERDEWDLQSTWRQVWDNLALERQGRDVSLLEETGGINLRCAIDPFRLGQVFRNLFENSLAACKDPARITIRCSETEWASRPAVRISVQDNGPGMAPEQKQRVFEPFYTTKTKGTGLGMPIAKRIVEAHGGLIAVGPGEGGGAETIITLPREEP